MQESLDSLSRSVETVSRNVSDQARTLSSLVTDQSWLHQQVQELLIDKVRREEREKSLALELKSINDRINGIYDLGKWVFAAIGAVLITVIVTFALRGGFTHGI